MSLGQDDDFVSIQSGRAAAYFASQEDQSELVLTPEQRKREELRLPYPLREIEGRWYARLSDFEELARYRDGIFNAQAVDPLRSYVERDKILIGAEYWIPAEYVASANAVIFKEDPPSGHGGISSALKIVPAIIGYAGLAFGFAMGAGALIGGETATGALVEEGAGELIAEELTAEFAAEELTAEFAAEELAAEFAAEELAAEFAAEELVAEELAFEEMVAKTAAEELATEFATEELLAETVVEEAISLPPATLPSPPPSTGIPFPSAYQLAQQALPLALKAMVKPSGMPVTGVRTVSAPQPLYLTGSDQGYLTQFQNNRMLWIGAGAVAALSLLFATSKRKRS